MKYFGYEKEEYIKCQELTFQTNTTFFKYLGYGGMIVLGIFVLLSFVLPNIFGRFQQIYTVGTVYTIGILLLYLLVPTMRKKAIAIIYLEMTVLFCVGAALSLRCPTEKATIFPMLMVILPIFIIDNFYRYTSFNLIATILYSLLVARIKVPQIAFEDIYDIIVFFVLGIIVYFVSRRILVKGLISRAEVDDTLDKYRMVQAELRERAQHDSLTKLYCRSAFIEEMEKCSISTEKIQALAILDIDHFKQFNDVYGHQLGDKVIVTVADVLTKSVDDGDIVGRLGGDEFILFLKDADRKENVQVKVEKILYELNGSYIKDNLEIRASVGVVILNEKNKDFDELYRCADIALYHAKSKVRNRMVFLQDTYTNNNVYVRE